MEILNVDACTDTPFLRNKRKKLMTCSCHRTNLGIRNAAKVCWQITLSSLKPCQTKIPASLVSSKHLTYQTWIHLCLMILRHSEDRYCSCSSKGQWFPDSPLSVYNRLQFSTKHSVMLFSHPRSTCWAKGFKHIEATIPATSESRMPALKMNMQYCTDMSSLLLWKLNEDKCHC